MRTLITFGLGALTMYLLDPEHGRRRRALLRDQLVRGRRVIRAEARRAVRTQLEPDKPTETPEGAQHLGR